MNNFSIGNKIKRLRKSNNLTRYELADKLQVKYSTLANYENDNRKPSIEFLLELSAFFNIDMDFWGNNTTNDYQKWRIDTKKIKKAITTHYYDDIVNMMGDCWEEADAPKMYREYLKLNNLTVRNREILISYFEELNDNGKDEAVKRVEELTHIPKYTDKDK